MRSFYAFHAGGITTICAALFILVGPGNAVAQHGFSRLPVLSATAPTSAWYTNGPAATQEATGWPTGFQPLPPTSEPTFWYGSQELWQTPTSPGTPHGALHPSRYFLSSTQPNVPSNPVSYTMLQDRAPAEREPSGTTRTRTRPHASDVFNNFLSTNSLTFWNDYLGIEGVANYPALGRVNLADNNSPMPRDRCFFVYNHYNNILDRSVDNFAATPLDRVSLSLDRYTFGGEKTFNDGLWSIEARMPFFASSDWLSSSGVGGSNPALGNLTITLKSLFYRIDTFAVSVGLGISAPTGDDVQFTFADQAFTINNDAVNLQPFVAFLATPTERTFAQGFLQLSVPLGGNEIEFRDLAAGGTPVSLGKLTDQNVLFLSLNSGYWLYRNQQSERITGIAGILELHYATALQNTNVVAGTRNGATANTGYAFDDARNRFDFVTTAFGIHTEIANRTTVRVAGIVPLSTGDNNFFDSEIHFSVNTSF